MEFFPIIKRERGENWTQEEKSILLEIMRQSAPIIESKKTDTNANKRKKYEWMRVQKRLHERTGKRRHIAQIKGFWRRLKQTAKTNLSKHKTVETEGGHQPLSPSDEDQNIADLCCTELKVENNEYDSDGVVLITVPDKVAEPNLEDYNAIYDCVKNEINEESEIEQSTSIINARHKHNKTESSHNTEIIQSNIDIKKRTLELIEEEYAIKMKYHTIELRHQEQRHKLEIDILLLEQEKKKLEIKLLKKSLD